MQKQFYEIIRTVQYEEILCIAATSEEEAVTAAEYVPIEAAGGERLNMVGEVSTAYVNSCNTDPNELDYYYPATYYDAESKTTKRID